MRFASFPLVGASCLLVFISLLACTARPSVTSGVPDQTLQGILLKQSKSHPVLKALYDAQYRPIDLIQNEEKTRTELTFGPCDLTQRATINECAQDGYSIDQPQVSFAIEGVPAKDGEFKLTGGYAVVSKQSIDGSEGRKAVCHPDQPSDFVLDSRDKILYLDDIVKQFLNQDGEVSSGSRDVDLTQFAPQTRASEMPVRKLWHCES